MSTTFHVECDTCRESLWIGQRSHMRSYLYFSEKKVIDTLEEFLFRHQTNMSQSHSLYFRPDSSSKFMDGQDGWTELK